jgi:hypothetical protein
MARHLMIVRRDETRLYHYLARHFAEEESVELIIDRRLRDRRQAKHPCGSSAEERRRGDRRTSMTHEERLRSLGYTIVVRPQG